MTTLETNAAPAEASGEGIRTPEKAVRWAIPLSLLACVLLAFFDKISIAALFSDSHFQQAMGIDFDTTRLGILMSAVLLSYGFSSVLRSGLGDRIAPLRLLTGMMAVWCVLMLVMGFTHNYTVMVTLRILLGIAEGPLFPLAFAIVRHTFPQRLQARATMLWLLGTPVGAAIGFPLSIWLLNTFGWQSTFFVMAMLTVPVLIFVRIGLRGVQLESKASGEKVSQEARRAARRELFVSADGTGTDFCAHRAARHHAGGKSQRRANVAGGTPQRAPRAVCQPALLDDLHLQHRLSRLSVGHQRLAARLPD